MGTLTTMTGANALSAGFTAVSGTGTLYTHPRWPGFLFKTVSTIEQAIACGAVYWRNANKEMAYFGLDAEFTFHAEKFGQYGIPTAMTAFPLFTLSPKVITKDANFSALHRSSLLFTEKTFGWSSIAHDGQFMGLVSKADRGFVYNTLVHGTETPPELSIPFSADPGFRAVWSGGTVNTHFEADGNANSKGRIFFTGGYIDCAVKIDKGAYFRAARAPFLADISSAEAREAYSKAFSSFLTTPQASGVTTDTVRLFAYWDTNRLVFSQTEKLSDSVVANGSARWSVPPADNSVIVGDAASEIVRARLRMRNNRSVNGMPVAQIRYSDLSGLSPIQAAEAALGLGYRQTPPGGSFNLDSLPFKKVKMATGQLIGSATLFARVSPKVKPASGATDVLDHNAILEAEMARFERAVALLVPPAEGASPEAKAEQVAKAADDLKLAVKDYKRILPMLHPMNAMLQSAVAYMDEYVATS